MANFTEEQVAQLAQNKNVAWVSKAGVQFTAEFKLLAWEQKQQGKRMREILRENGIDPDMLGRKRIENLSMRVNDLGRAGGDFSDQRVYNGRPAANERRKDMSLEDRVLWLTNELAYTKQEVEFLKNCKWRIRRPGRNGDRSTGTGKVCAYPPGRPEGRKPAEHPVAVPDCGSHA